MQKTKTRNSIGHARSKELAFKYLYFKFQRLINKKVTISLKYEQLKQPEINLALIKPLTTEILDKANGVSLNNKIYKDFKMAENKPSLLVIHILLIIRYEFLIQSESNLIIYDLLTTKATVCELLAIRMLREYKALDRINLLFVNPLKKFTTIELAALSKSKKFLSQPVIIQVLNKFYNGELIKNEYNDEESPLLNQNISNYRYQRLSLGKVNERSIYVPKYQSLIINIKNFVFTILHISIILRHSPSFTNTILETAFLALGINFNYEFIIKVWYIDYQFLSKILWFYLDFFILLLVDFIIILKILVVANKLDSSTYYEIFSLLAIMLIPRNLAIFNNYKFFNLIILGFKKMMLNMMGLFCLFLSLISGFYVSFISLNFHRSNYEIAFDLLQIFFGFTPAVWQNWNTYHSLGKFVQVMYLFLSHFIISAILAIVLSEVFSTVSSNITEEFEYFKTVNLLVYFKTSTLSINKFYWSRIPIFLVIYLYETINSNLHKISGDKSFTFLNKQTDYYGDNDLVNIEDDEVSMFIKSRKPSAPNATPSGYMGTSHIVASGPIIPMASRRYSQVDANNQFAQFPQTLPNYAAHTPGLMPVQSISTLGNFKSASTDSLFIDDILSKKYGTNLVKTRPKKEIDLLILEKLENLEAKLSQLEMRNDANDTVNTTILQGIEAETNSVHLYNIQEASFDDLDLIESDTLEYSDDTF